MRIPSGKTDQAIYFVAFDSVDLVTRKTGLTSFTVYRSRNAAAPVLYTTPTISELSAANMPGVYALVIDEDTTIASTSDSEEMALHITQASMAPVTRTVELYANADAILDRASMVETGVTLRGMLRLLGAVMCGKLSGAGTGTEVFRNAVADSKNRVSATVDSSGNRTAITADQT